MIGVIAAITLLVVLDYLVPKAWATLVIYRANQSLRTEPKGTT